MSKLQRFSILLLIFSTYLTTITTLSCLNREGNQVPWFTLIKYPNKLMKTGARYAYFDPNIGSSSYKIVLGSTVDSQGEALPNTIEAINAISKHSLNLLVYNDQPPEQDFNPNGAHAKGIIAFDNQTNTGVFIMHSVPKFPSVTESTGYISYALPQTSQMFGQNAYCITLNKASLHVILSNLPVEEPNIYYSSGLFNGLSSRANSGPLVNQFSLVDGEDQWILTKSPDESEFLFEDIIAPYFDVSLAVESWGRPYQKPVCPENGGNAIVNIDQIALNSQDTWAHTLDHSKWAISIGGKDNVACLCDMNRMDSQQVRGGSCLCSKNRRLYTALDSIVVEMDKCGTDYNDFDSAQDIYVEAI